MFARTQRLTLRHGWPEDAPALTRAIAHESVVTMVSRVPWPYALGDAETFLCRPRTDRDAIFLILAHQGGEQPVLVGGIGVHPYESGHEIGYWITPSAWGQGYATEAGHAVLHAARHSLGLRRIVGRHFLDNPASGRVLGKLGFRATGEVGPLFSQARGGEAPSAILEIDLGDDQKGLMPLAA